jgi:hypothetical protein
MSIGSLGVIGGLAGLPVAQNKGSEVERSQHDTVARQRQSQGDLSAEQAAGIGATGEDNQASDRDADGRRLWERPLDQSADDGDQPQGASPPASTDSTGQSGTQLDLTA